MAQDKFKIDNVVVHQPDEANPNWESTYTEDTDRFASGLFHGSVLFTVESYSLTFSNLKPAEAAAILQKVIPTPAKTTYMLHYFSWYTGRWQDAEFYTGKGSLKVKTLKDGLEGLDTISFNAIKVAKLV